MVRTDEGREKENISNHEIERRGETGKLKIEIRGFVPSRPIVLFCIFNLQCTPGIASSIL